MLIEWEVFSDMLGALPLPSVFFFLICVCMEKFINVQHETGSLVSMLEIKINILKGVNKRLRVSNFIRSMHWDM